MPPGRPAPSSPGGPPRSHHQAWPLRAPEPSPWGSQPLAAQGNIAGSRTGERGSSDPREPSRAPLPSVVCEVSGAPGHPWGGPGPRRAHPQAPPTFREAGRSCPALGLSFPICSVDLMFPSPPSFPVLRISRTEQVEWAGHHRRPGQSYFGGTCLGKPRGQPAHRGPLGRTAIRPSTTGLQS